MDERMERLHKARTGLVLSSPFFGALALHLDMKVDEKSEHAFWTDGRTLGVSPKAVDELELPELEGMIARGILHAALGHVFRREGREPQRWNEAAANVAGLEVLAAGMKLPPGSPVDKRFKGMTVEQAYAMLAPPPEEGDGEGSGKPQDGAGEQQPGGGGASPSPGEQPGKGPQKPGQQEGPQSAPGSGQGEGPGEAGKPASGVPGEPEGAENALGSGEVRDAPGDEAGIEEQATEWQEKVAQAAQLARGAGKLPGELERAAMGVIDARVAWQEALFRFFKAKAKDDHSWLAPSRRYMPLGLYMPSQRSLRLGDIAVAVDMSASISQREIDVFLGELQAIRAECNPERVILIPFDSSVRRNAVREFGEFDELELKAKSGGGTDFRPAVAYLAEQGIVPEALVYLTDLDCGSFADEPEYPVLWATTRSERAPYGEVIRLTI